MLYEVITRGELIFGEYDVHLTIIDDFTHVARIGEADAVNPRDHLEDDVGFVDLHTVLQIAADRLKCNFCRCDERFAFEVVHIDVRNNFV